MCKKLFEKNKYGVKFCHKLWLTKMVMRHSKSKITYENMLSESLTFNEGVEQGDGLLATLLIIALHYTIKDKDQRGTIL